MKEKRENGTSRMRNTAAPWFLGLSEDFLMRKTMWARFFRKMRRAYFGIFHREYVRQSIESRKGDCHRCGACCELLYKCPFLGHDAQSLPYCRIYGDLR